MTMYEAERREADMLFRMSEILKAAAEEINRLAIRCDEYASSYDALDDDYERLAAELEKVKEENNNG